MKENDLIARAETRIEGSREHVWEVLTNPEAAKQYMFGATIKTDWKEGSSITWQGEWKGQSYKDKGTIVKAVPFSLLQYTHFSPLTGEDDKPENYHTVTISLLDESGKTKVVLTQDGNKTQQAMQHSQENWKLMLDKLKQLVENHL